MKNSVNRIIKAICYSLDGLKSCFKTEAAFRQEILLFVLVCPIPFCLETTGAEKALLYLSIIIVLIAELFNTAIEAVVDRVSTEHHELLKIAKDTGSAGVFLSLIAAGIVWILVLF